jgi:hypothetical protein
MIRKKVVSVYKLKTPYETLPKILTILELVKVYANNFMFHRYSEYEKCLLE